MADIVYQHPELAGDNDKQYLPPQVGGFSRSSKKYIYKYHDNSFAELPSLDWLRGNGGDTSPATAIAVSWSGNATNVKAALDELNTKLSNALVSIPSNYAQFAYLGHIDDMTAFHESGHGYILGSEAPSGTSFSSSEKVTFTSYVHTETQGVGANALAAVYLFQKLEGNDSNSVYTRTGSLSPQSGAITYSSWVKAGSSQLTSSGYYTTLVGTFLQQNAEFGYSTGQRLYLYRAKAALPFAMSKARMAASVSSGSVQVCVYTVSGSTLTLVATGTMSFSSAGFNDVVLNNTVNISAGQIYYMGVYTSYAQAGSNSYIAGLTASAPMLSANYGVADRPIAYIDGSSASPPASVSLASTSVPASATIPFMELIQV